jgi:beta-lactamase superfamily II metal-dependent hydrolase
MSKFIALPVGQGDAFYLERQGMKVLVDGGRSKSAISGLISDVAKSSHLDVVICTHNDADHADGIIGLLENWPGIIKEVWLPGSWTFRMKDLFVNPTNFLNELIDNIDKEDGEFD